MYVCLTIPIPILPIHTYKHTHFIILFERCRAEQRNLITTSYKLILRKECPPGAYLINPSSKQDMETTLAGLLLTHGVVLEPTKFLSRCVQCNGSFGKVSDEEEKRRIFELSRAPVHLLGLTVWKCEGCGKGYWWSDQPGSSASRVKNGVTYLSQRALRAGVEYKGPLDMFSFVDVEKERRYNNSSGDSSNGSGSHDTNNGHSKMEALQWLKNDALGHPFEIT